MRSLANSLILGVLGAALAIVPGCAQPWRFGSPAPSTAVASKSAPPGCAVGPEGPASDSTPQSASNKPTVVPESSPWPGPTIAAGFAAEPPADEARAFAPPAETPIATPWPANDAIAAPPSRSRASLLLQETTHDIVCDYRGYYSWPTLRDLGLAVALAAPLANTSLDDDFQNWYQRDVRTRGTDDLASFWKPWGEGKIFIPAWAGLAVAGKLLDDFPLCGAAGELGYRTTRAYLVGAPPMLLMQFTLGGSRPGETRFGSQWKPFDDTNAVSGHAFIGAVPFITAAKMVQNPWAKGTLYTLSTFTAWSRVNDNRHYLSQVCLGWYMAYLAARAVEGTEMNDQRFAFTPVASPQMTGVALSYRR